MRILSPDRLLELSDRNGCATAGVAFREIDFDRPFVPEEVTHLYYSPLYARLNRRQRLRYNQLFGLRLNENFQLFEGGFAIRVLRMLAAERRDLQDPTLQLCLVKMIDEEEQHHVMFRALNRLCLPEVYGRQDYYFVEFKRLESVLLRLLVATSAYLTMLMWVILFMEEWSANLSRAILRNRQTQSLGPLEANFVRAHSAHLRDEARHVHIDVNLIRNLVARMPEWKGAIDAWLVRTLTRSFVMPRRSGVAVVRRLVQEEPSLAPMENDMIDAALRIRYEPRFLKALFDPDAAPLTFRLFAELPQFKYVTSLSDV